MTLTTLQEVMLVLPDADTFATARCVGRWAEWETDALEGEDQAARVDRLRWAAEQCQQCTALDSCRSLADGTPKKHRAHQVWAGVVPPLSKESNHDV